MHIPNPLYKSATALIERCREKKVGLVTAESCTGGLIISALTEIAGSSDVVMQGFVTYSNEAKVSALGVPMTLIEEQGAVSDAVARRMAEGAVAGAARCEGRSIVALSVTGIAGPTGGSDQKPVGTVYFAIAGEKIATSSAHCRFEGDRQDIRLAAVERAFFLVNQALV